MLRNTSSRPGGSTRPLVALLLACLAVIALASNERLRDFTAVVVTPKPDEIVELWQTTPSDPSLKGISEAVQFQSSWFGSPNRTAFHVITPTLSVFRPKTSNGKAILIIPGGGYGFIAFDNEGTDIAQFFARHGFAAYVLKYRLPGEGWSAGPDAPLQDAQRAIRMIRSRAEQDRIDPEKILTIGFSAGGHLAGTLATKFDQRIAAPSDALDSLSARPDLVAFIYPVVTMRPPFAHQGSVDNLLGESPTEADRVDHSLEHAVRADTPPAFILHAKDDPIVPFENALMLHQSYQRAKVGSRLILLETGGHGFGLNPKRDPAEPDWPTLVIEWSRSQFDVEQKSKSMRKMSDGL